MELNEAQKKFLLEVLDKVQVQGIANVAMIVSIYQALSAQLQANGSARVIEQVSAQEEK